MRYATETWSSPSRHEEQAASLLTLGSRAVASILPLLLVGCSLGPAVVSRERTGAISPSVHEATSAADPQRIPAGPLVPLVDYHRHLMSPAAARLDAEAPLPAVEVPEDLARVLRERTEHWNDSTALAQLYTEGAVLLDPTGPRWVRGRRAVAERVARYFRRAPYRMTPVAWGLDGDIAYVSGYLTRDEADHITHVALTLENGEDGAWRIASESFVLGGPAAPELVTAEQLVSQLAEAGIQRALVLSLAYWFGSPYWAPVEDEYAKVRAENDWTADQVARFPDQLVAFCSFNPLEDYALAELERCAANPHLNGLKLHFANSQVDVFDPEHVEKLRRVFRAANRQGLPIVVHLWVPGGTYGRRHAEVFLERILLEAPDVVVQIAHFAGGGPGYTDEALAVYAEAIAAGDARTRNLYFDIASVAEGLRTRTELFLFAERIRQVGLERVLFGADMVPPPALEPWIAFRSRVPLTEAEFRAIADNIAPYLR